MLQEYESNKDKASVGLIRLPFSTNLQHLLLKGGTMKQDIISPLPDVEYIYINNTKLAKEILCNHITADGYWNDLNVFNDVSIKVALRHINNEEFQFKMIDTLIMDVIGSLYDNAIYKFTTDMIARIIFHDTHHRTSKKVLQTIEERIDLLMELQIRLDIENEYISRESYPKDRRLQNKRYANFLPIKAIDATFSANSKRGTGYHLYQSPPIWEYAKYTKQIIACRFDAFSFYKKHMTIESLFILQYVYRRIETMKNTHNNVYNRKICLYRIENKVPKGLLADCEINPSTYKNWNDKHRKICQLIVALLEHLKTTDVKEMRIKDYHYYKTINAEGYHIDLYSKKYYNYKK